MDIIHINYDIGEMTVVLDNFFPTSQHRIKLLMDTVKKDWESRDQLIIKIKNHLNDRIEKVYKSQKELVNDHVTNQEEYFKKYGRERAIKNLNRDYEKLNRLKQRFIRNLEYVEKLSC